LIGSATAYFGTLLPNNYHCKEVSIRTVNRDDFHRLAKMLSVKKSEVQKIKTTNDVGTINVSPTNVLDDYFGGIML
jgi:hypothetical protein